MPYTIGQTATNPKTGQKVKWDGANWVGVPGTGTGRAAGISPSDQKFLNELTTEAATASETHRIYDRAEQAIHKLHTGPYRGAFMQAATPEDNGGILDRVGAIAIGGPARVLGAIKPEETSAYQTLRGLQSQQVLQAQLAQKGPQTESDAARMMLTEISPSKSPDVNLDIINRGRQKLQRVQAKASFFSQWAQKYGLHGTNEKGMTATDVWSRNQDAITASMFKPKAASTSTIKVLSRTKVR
jgi:hypothetical protein